MLKLPTVWSERYCVDAAPTNSTSKQARVVDMVRGILDITDVELSSDAAWADIARVHSPDYVNAVRTGRPRGLAESQGFSWSPAFAESVARIWNGHSAACTLARIGRIVLHPVSGAHHAHRDRGGGFCTFNFLAGEALNCLRDSVASRVLIVDLDAHQGDGTYALAGGDSRIALFDIAGSDWMGGSGRGSGRVQYAVVRDSESYWMRLQRLPALLDSFAPDLVQYQAGVDCYEGDPVGGIRGVTADFIAERDRYVINAIADRHIPMVINLAGGYTDESEQMHAQTIRIALDALVSHA